VLSLSLSTWFPPRLKEVLTQQPLAFACGAEVAANFQRHFAVDYFD